MNQSEISSLTIDFQQTYDNTETPIMPQQLSGYRFVSCLTDSGQKKVWLLEKANGQKVLCKYAAGEYMELLRTESTFFSLGQFSFVPYVFDYFETEDGAYLLREYIEGQTLNELVEKEGPLSLSRTVSLLEQICSHLSRLHTSVPPIIYRDLKPSNIILHPSGDCYLIDMGTVRTYHEDNSLDTVFIGTIDTAAPEQFGARQTDNRTDIYALGVLFYYLLTGEVKIQRDKLKKLPAKAASVIRKCTAFDPDNRYSQVSKVIAELHVPVRTKICLAAVLASICTAMAFFVGFSISASVQKHSIANEPAIEDFIPESPESENPVEVVFSSSLLEQAVREAVKKTDREPVYEEDLIRITRLSICGKTVFNPEADHDQYPYAHTIQGHNPEYGDIADISLLAKMPNLHYVTLDYQQIYDLSPLADLQLVSLSLCGNPIADLSALEGQKTLTELYIAETSVFSLEALSECSILSLLDCSKTSVLFLEPVASLPLNTLLIVDTSIRDFEVLSETSLQHLICSHVPKESIDMINNISSLRGLTIYSSDITSLKELSSLSNLIQLDVFANHITDLDGVEQFTNLKALTIGNNPITDLSPLAKMSNLSNLGVGHSPDWDPGTYVDFSFLYDLPYLEWISVTPSQADALYEAVPEPWFYVDVSE